MAVAVGSHGLATFLFPCTATTSTGRHHSSLCSQGSLERELPAWPLRLLRCIALTIRVQPLNCLQFKGSLERELAAAEADREAFIADFGREDYDEVRGLEMPLLHVRLPQ